MATVIDFTAARDRLRPEPPPPRRMSALDAAMDAQLALLQTYVHLASAVLAGFGSGRRPRLATSRQRRVCGELEDGA
jgi:hypothetical protein